MRIKRILVLCSVVVSFAGCGEEQPVSKKDRAVRIAEEKSKQNLVQKSRYDCWELTAAGDRTSSLLYILSDEIYQFGELTGRYVFNAETSTIVFTRGPLHQVGDLLVGVYTPQGTATASGGKNAGNDD